MKDFSKSYYDLLVGEYKGINLTRITDYEEFYNKQILDSVEPLKHSSIFTKEIESSEIYIDIGFGGGFPILPLAHKLPNKKFLGIETRGKKVKVVGEIAQKLGLNNVSLLHERIENVLIDIPAVCSLKAVGKVDDFLGRINCPYRTTVFFYKGPNFYELEKESLKNISKTWRIIEEKEINIPGTEKRYLIGFEPKNVPHGTKNGKQLVKLSDILKKAETHTSRGING